MFWFKKRILNRAETISSMFQTTSADCEADCLEIIEKQGSLIKKNRNSKNIDYDIKDIKIVYLDKSEATKTYNLFVVLTVEYVF